MHQRIVCVTATFAEVPAIDGVQALVVMDRLGSQVPQPQAQRHQQESSKRQQLPAYPRPSRIRGPLDDPPLVEGIAAMGLLSGYSCI